MILKITEKTPIKLKKDDRNVFLFREEKEKLIIQGTHVIYVLGEIEKDIYNMIDNKKNINDIVKALTLKYNHPKKKILKDVIVFLKKLSQAKLINFKKP